jgi:hypothetical protein
VTTKLRYITGRGGSATQGLSLYLSTLVEDYQALANNSELHKLSIDEQINVIRGFCEPATHIIANSYGAYLWLLSRIDVAPSSARVLLLSPVMGRSVDPEKMILSRPPRLGGLETAISDGRFCVPTSISVYTGQDDPICDYQTAQKQCARLGITALHILERETHALSHSAVANATAEFLLTSAADY